VSPCALLPGIDLGGVLDSKPKLPLGGCRSSAMRFSKRDTSSAFSPAVDMPRDPSDIFRSATFILAGDADAIARP